MNGIGEQHNRRKLCTIRLLIIHKPPELTTVRAKLASQLNELYHDG